MIDVDVIALGLVGNFGLFGLMNHPVTRHASLCVGHAPSTCLSRVKMKFWHDKSVFIWRER